MAKNPNRQEGDQLGTYLHGQGGHLETTENNTSQWSEQDLNPRPYHSATLSPIKNARIGNLFAT